MSTPDNVLAPLTEVVEKLNEVAAQFVEIIDHASDSLIDTRRNHAVDGEPGKKYSQSTLKSQMKKTEKELSQGARFIIGKRGEKVQLTEKRFVGMADAASRRRQARMGNKRFTPKD